MPVMERDVVLTGMVGGRQTMDFPVTRLANVEDSAEVKDIPAAEDYLPIMDAADGGQMKKAPLSAILEPLSAAQEALKKAITKAQLDEAIQAAVLASWEGSY